MDKLPLPPAEDAVVCGPLWVSPQEMCEVRIRGRRVSMSVRQMAMLAQLLIAGGRLLSRDELRAASGAGTLPEGSHAVAVEISRIRRALGALGRYVISVRERGYRIDVVGLANAR